MLTLALFSHYRRHPFQLLALLLMIALATALWTGVNTLTRQAADSLAQSETAVAERQQVLRSDGQPVTVEDFADLRRAGVCVAPWLEVRRPPPAGNLIGIDGLAFGCFGEEAPVRTQEPLTGEPFLDISEAMTRIRDSQTALESRLILILASASGSGSGSDSVARAAQLPEGYVIRAFELSPPTGELADSFLLNLDALGLLVLLISALLLRSVYQLGLNQRRESFALLQRFGVTQGEIRRVLVLELSGLSLLAIFPGLWLGQVLAEGVGSGFGQAMSGLFDQTLYASEAGLPWTQLLVMLTLVLLACFARPGHFGNLPGLRNTTHRLASLGSKTWIAVALSVGLMLVIFAEHLFLTFTGTTFLFLAVGAASPGCLASTAKVPWARFGSAKPVSDPLALWRSRELAVLFRRLALPVVALQFAMATVIAVQALVTSFEDTFQRWLGQRLTAELYIAAPQPGQSRDENRQLALSVMESLEAEGLGAWHRVTRGRAKVSLANPDGGVEARIPVDVLALDQVTELVRDWELLSASPDPWAEVAAGAILINEQLALRAGLGVGDPLKVTIGQTAQDVTVAGVYADYGRPTGEILWLASRLPADFEITLESFSVNPGSVSRSRLEAEMAKVWQQPVTIRDNAGIRQLADTIFDQTFALTQAISLFTLALGSLSLLLMGWVFLTARAWYFHLLKTWGLTSREVSAVLRRLALGLSTRILLAALPLGIGLTWILVHRINPLAFGWTLPMAVYPVFWLELLALSAVIGLVIAGMMTRQLRQSAPQVPGTSAIAGGER